MYNQTDAILSQYEIEVNEVVKGRGSYICSTNQGMKVLLPFSGSKEKGEFLRTYLNLLQENGFIVEQIMANAKGEAITEEEGTGERFLLKDYFPGIELNTGQITEMEEAVALLANYHKVSQMVQNCVPERMKESIGNVIDSRQRHYRELVKVKNYIKNRKKKNEFEQIYMKHFLPMLVTAEASMKELEKISQKNPKCDICHGEFNQHNVIYRENKWYMVNFENFLYSWRVMDLANFLRKMLEKTSWDTALGMRLIEVYDKHYSLSKEDMCQLYGLLLFPEKFWKITNHYINSRKAWISGRDIDKLKKVIEQEQARLNFMENLFKKL